ncbi:hypothetical protein [Actinomadura flavalba]|uniref:hypothetical protein n=1 Tax=Actinomadura flavalba TaxID=1120938 RepID=UPI0003A70B27|nr:hypothetical protein [Actinomadura flavalba]
MRAALSVWTAAAILAVLALLTLKVLAVGPGTDDYAEVLRGHLPWLVACVFMGLAAGAPLGEPRTLAWSLAVSAPVPLIALVLRLRLAIPGEPGPRIAVVAAIEAAFGIVLGLAVISFFVERRGGRRRSAEGEIWRESRG